jgi:hypothetical protein
MGMHSEFLDKSILWLSKSSAYSLFHLWCAARLRPHSRKEVLPEIDVHLKLDSSIRLRVQTANTREGGDPTQVTIGPDLELYVNP